MVLGVGFGVRGFIEQCVGVRDSVSSVRVRDTLGNLLQGLT